MNPQTDHKIKDVENGGVGDKEKPINNHKSHKDDDDDDDDDDGNEDRVVDDGVLFKDMTSGQKCRSVVIVIIKLILFLACLYIFICSLGLLESAFQLLGGKTAGHAFSSGVLSNPLAGLMIGVLATVLVQSSSTSTSIVVTMVGSKIIPIKNAVPIIMGANIGTSVTNTIVSLAQASNRKEFRRAFAGATVHDMFNWLSVIVLLPLEIAVGYLYWLSGLLVESMGLEGNNEKAPDMLKAITEPLLDAIVEINKNVISDIAKNSSNADGEVLHRWCGSEVVVVNKTVHHERDILVNCTAIGDASPLRATCDEIRNDPYTRQDFGNASITVEWDTIYQVNSTQNTERCENLFAKTDLHDAAVGAILLVCSLLLLLGALFFIVKILNSILSGSVSRIIKKTINADFPYPFAYFTSYVAMLVGMGMTIVVQSSSVFTSTLTPMVGLGIVSVERMYPMTLGSNVGTTITAILAALSQSGDKLRLSLQIAMCHLFFNITGIVIFFPIPFMRWPVGLAKILGKTTAKHRWFAIAYIIFMFILLPASIFALSYAGWIYLGAVGGPLLLLAFIVSIINVLQKKRPSLLPRKLRNWDFMPEWCHSLKPIDRLIERVFTCTYCRTLQKASQKDEPNALELQKEVAEPDEKEVGLSVESKMNGSAHTGHVAKDVTEISTIKENDDNTKIHSNGVANGVSNKGFEDDTRL